MANVSPTIETPRALSRTKSVRVAEWESIFETHQGQRYQTPREQFGKNNTVSDQTPLAKKRLALQEPSTRDGAAVLGDAGNWRGSTSDSDCELGDNRKLPRGMCLYKAQNGIRSIDMRFGVCLTAPICPQEPGAYEPATDVSASVASDTPQPARPPRRAAAPRRAPARRTPPSRRPAAGVRRRRNRPSHKS
jgi:hypothetical protein